MTEPHWQHRWRSAPLDWSPAYRVIPTRFPAVNLFDRVASPEDFDALHIPGGVINPDKLRTIPEAVNFVKAFFDLVEAG